MHDNKEITFDLMKQIGVLGEGRNGWLKEINLVSWNGREAKLDIREWSDDHLRMGKGITLTREEGTKLASLLASFLGKR